MIILASLAPLVALIAAPAQAVDRSSADAAPRCALHHLPLPSGKGLITTVMRCSDRKETANASALEQRPAEMPEQKSLPSS
ncbi:MAG: hypothetical protein B7Y45_03680 [Sphingomonas sp. 28-66-16]|nr:MAG: hypothetical protein B7Y45_03680 [Sphingomonas sp. 28-66-16]